MSRADIYRMLAQLYNYTPQQIAEMTREQQFILLSDNDAGTVKFKDYAEYMQAKRKGMV